MTKDEAFQTAVSRIEAARNSGADSLDLSKLQLAELPNSIGDLRQLKRLDLTHNLLVDLPESLARLQQLEELELSSNQFSALPECIEKLTALQFLYLSLNRLGSIPTWIHSLVSLRQLIVTSNDISSVPAEIGRLLNLEYLCLGYEVGGNPIAELPDVFDKLTKFRDLTARQCRLTSLPPSLASAPLEVLDLKDNPLNPELAAAYADGLPAVLRYLKANAEDQEILNEAKLILIGEGEVGKSALLGALRGEDWVDNRSSTHGIEIKPVKVTDPLTGTEITLNGWDFGGQRVYRPTHQLFFSAPAVYLVVWKPREGHQQGFVREWIRLVKHREPDAKILVVATHGGPGGRQPDIDRQEIWDVFGRQTVVDFFHVDSRPNRAEPASGQAKPEGQGIGELKAAIARVAASLPEVGRSVPRRWQQARRALTTSGDAYLSLDRALEICQAHSVTEDDARVLLRICRRVGDLIHYEHDPLLQNIVVLKPDWLATALSFVLDDEKTRANYGLVSFERLSRLWNDQARPPEFRYPPNLHAVFLRLMERFDLSYRVAGSPLGDRSQNTSLVAQLVPDVRPADNLTRAWSDKPAPGDEEQVQICRIVDAKGHTAIAEGLFYQLIVRLHKFSLGKDDFDASVHWQRGLVVDDGYNGRALLEHAANDVRITVRAAYPGNLLAVLTNEVKWLVEDFWEGLRCEIVVPCLEPCGKALPGTAVFEVQKLVAFKKQGMALFPCPVSGCDRAQDIQGLLQNAPSARRPSLESLLVEGFAGVSSRLEGLREQNSNLSLDLRRMMSQVDDAFAGVMRAFADEGKEGPRLFSMEPVDRSAFNPNGWVSKRFRVTLWCEHSRLPLPLINPDEKDGVYEFDVSREWVAKAAPFLQTLTATLSLVLPLAASGTKLVLDELIYKRVKDQLDFGKDCASAILASTGQTAEWLAQSGAIETDRTGTIRAEGGVLREFQGWLKEQDPTFGHLRRVLNKRQEFLWVHPYFEKEY